jgi:hypothetical protein
MKEYLKSRQYLQEQFLRNKGMKYEDCTERQKQILKAEIPEVWDIYNWDI